MLSVDFIAYSALNIPTLVQTTRKQDQLYFINLIYSAGKIKHFFCWFQLFQQHARPQLCHPLQGHEKLHDISQVKLQSQTITRLEHEDQNMKLKNHLKRNVSILPRHKILKMTVQSSNN